MVRESVRRRKEWERSRRCGWEIDVGADVAAGRLMWEPIQRLRGWFREPISIVFRRTLQLFYREFSGAENEK